MNEAAPHPNDVENSEFSKLGVGAALVSALVRLRMDAPTEIQVSVIPVALEGRDCLARASTGAGKTNAYLLPILQNLKSGDGLQALIVQPTRALAQQLDRNIKRFAPDCEVGVAVATGARRGRDEEGPLDGNPEIVIATPRGASDLIRANADRDWSNVRTVVIDELDAILDDSGADHLKKLGEALSHEHQTILLTSEIDEPVRELADKLLSDPFEAGVEPGPPRALETAQNYYAIGDDDKFDVLITFCKQQKPKLAIVMVNNEDEGHEMVDRLGRVHVTCRWIDERRSHGGRDQGGGRRPGGRDTSEVIVACDPAPRRMSTIPASHLVNYDIPENPDIYLQRLEQAGRLRRAGEVITFVEGGQDDLREAIEERIGKPLTLRETPQRPEHLRRERSDSRGGQRGDRGGQGERGDRGDRGGRGGPRGGRGDRKTGGGRSSGGGSSSGSSKSKPSNAATGRLNKTLHRDGELEDRGVKPPPRTLGSRFRPNSKPKRLRRPGK